MNILSFEDILKMAEQSKEIVLVGAGNMGINMLALLRENHLEPMCFFDNDEKMQGDYINGIQIIKMQKKEGAELYIICVKNEKVRKELYEQLLSVGISSKNIVAQQYRFRTYEYLRGLKEEEIKRELDTIYFETFHKRMNWENPKTYNEKLNWEKVFVNEERKTRLADKYLVRDHVKEVIGEEYLTKLYGVWNKAEEIDFSLLPNQFVLKTNNGSGRNIIVTDKSKLDKKKACEQLNEWIKQSFYYTGFEIQYKDIAPKILCEEYLEGVAENLYDYDIFCFHGEPQYIWCIKGSHRKGCKASFYDLHWNKQPFSYGYPIDEKEAPKPEKLEEMLELSRKLSRDFKHVRVDWYQYPASQHGILFSEMTFTTWSGMKHFVPQDYDRILGDMI